MYFHFSFGLGGTNLSFGLIGTIIVLLCCSIKFIFFSLEFFFRLILKKANRKSKKNINIIYMYFFFFFF